MVKRVKVLLGKSLEVLLKITGIDLLTKEETENYLKPYQIASSPESCILMPDVQDAADHTKSIFNETEAVALPGYVWNYTRNGQKVSQLPYGGIRVGNQLFCTNFGQHHLVENLGDWRNRKPYTTKVVIAPWSHYLDGVEFGGYYDFVILVAARLCRIKDALPEEVFAKAIVSYPLFDTGYERELLALIGIEPERIVDSRHNNVMFERVILANTGHWFYPSMADIISLKKYVESNVKPKRSATNRIYISRSGRRRIVNESALLVLLQQYNFVIVEDKPRTVAEQIDIYKNASFIMGPHGASFTNVVWCEPGTHLFELFSAGYTPEHFLYLANLMNMTYSAYYHGPKNEYGLVDDIYVSIPEIDACLAKLLVEA